MADLIVFAGFGALIVACLLGDRHYKRKAERLDSYSKNP